ncbi:MAG: AAA family ATPase [Myxococcales bacterium]|nr:AAA family ATPase [Myxococcales bacterium]
MQDTLDQTVERYRFYGFELDGAALRLSTPESQVEAPPRAIELLLYLARHRRRVVPKDELLEALWGAVHVSDNSLSQAVWSARRAVHDTGGAQRVIRSLRGRGYQFVADLQLDTKPPEASRPQTASPPPAPGRLAQPLLGRDAELEALQNALGRLHGAGQPQLLVVHGEAGSGKTRLLRELRSRAAALPELVVAEGRCHQDAAMPPFWPLQQCLRGLMRGHGSDEIARWAGPDAAELSRLIPELDECLPPLRERSRDDAPEDDRYALFAAFEGFLQRLADERPLLLLLEDLHWCDASSDRLLRYLAEPLADARVLLAVSFRTLPGGEAEADDDSGLRQVLCRSSIARELELGPLGDADLETLLRGDDGAQLTAEELRRARQLSGGNPFFALQLQRIDWRADGSSEVGDGRAGRIMRQRLAQLPAAARTAVEMASVLDDEVHVADLVKLEAVSQPELLRALEPALAAGLIAAVEHEPGCYRFAHPIVREAILQQLPQGRRLQYHRRFADAVAQSLGDDPTPRLSTLAFHYHAAATTPELAQLAVNYGRLAAERALEASAYEEAQAHYRRALQAAQRIESVSPRTRLELELGLARAEGTSAKVARTRLAEVARRARDIGERELLADAALARAGYGPTRLPIFREPGTIDAEEIALLELALDAHRGADSRKAALLLSYLATALYNGAQPERIRSLVDEALAMARRLGDRRLLCEVLIVVGGAIRGPGELPARIELLDELIAEASALELKTALLGAHRARGWAHWEAGRLGAAQGDIDISTRIAGELNHPRAVSAAGGFGTMLDACDGIFEEPAAFPGDRRNAVRSPGSGRINQGAMIRVFWMRFMRGRVGEIVPPLEAMAQKFPLPIVWHCGLLAAYAATGQEQAARRELERYAANDFRTVRNDHNYLGAHGLLAYVACEVGTPAHAAKLRELLAPYAGRVIIFGLGGYSGGVVQRVLGELSLASGELERAEQELRAGIEADRALGINLWANRGRLSLARILLERGSGAERSEAGALIAEALDFARRRDLGLMRDEAEGLRQRLQAND